MMKVLIDIPDDHKRVIDNLVEDGKGYLLPQEVETRLAMAVKIGTVIPEGATNGDMIKLIFPNMQIDNECNGILYGYKTNDREMPMLGMNLDWWNAPYKE